MRVLHVISDQNIGGAGVLLCNLLRNFEGEIQSAVALPAGSILAERIEKIGVPVYRLAHACDRVSPPSVRELCAVIRKTKAEIVHANAAMCARVAGRRCGVAVVHTRHCCYPLQGVWRIAPIRFLGGVWNRRLSDCAIATAESAVTDLRRIGIPENRITVIPNGSEPIRATNDEELETARRKWGLHKEDLVVGICARLELCKGHETFLRAAALLCKKHPDAPFRFLIVGTGSRRTALVDLARLLGLHGQVVFTGFVEDMTPVYRLLRVNVNCSVGTETSCLALSEGMSAGVPCVVSDYGGNRAMVGESQAGLVYPIGNAEALADAVWKILSDSKTEEKMRCAATERFWERYTAKGMADRVAELYRTLV